MKPTVYIETTIVSYLTARPSQDAFRRVQQQTTRNWWKGHRRHFQLYCSELVVLECKAGDEAAAAGRLKAIRSIKLLDLPDSATQLADALLRGGAIPPKAARDAAHVGICAIYG